MKNNKSITFENNRLTIPLELYEAMNKPRVIKIIPMDNPHIAEIERFDIKLFPYLLYRLKRALYTTKRKKQLPKLIHLVTLDKDFVSYKNIARFKFKFSSFHIVNYHPCYYLMPSNNMAEPKSREKSWKEIKEYHEHLGADLQDKNAYKVSDWFTKDVLRKLKSKTFLELGCGAGRNLISIHKNIKGAATTGIDINKDAIYVAKNQLSRYNTKLIVGSIYELSKIPDNSIDVVFTCGVLMHIPHEKVIDIIKQMNRIAKIAVVHFELDGPSHNFDYHRYPRDYRKLYHQEKLNRKIIYKRFRPTDFRSNMAPPFSHALLVSKKLTLEKIYD